MIDLNPKHLVTIQHILAVNIPECEVRAFGSRVKWTAEDYSDLDLAVVGSEPLPLRQLRKLKEAFEESDLPIRVDVLDWHTISDAFKDVIGEEYEVIKDRKSDERCDQPRNSCKNQSITIDESLLKAMPLGSPPSGWDVVRLADVTSFISTGATPRGGKNVYKSEGISLICSQNVYDHEFSKDGLARIDNSAAYKLRRVNVKEDDVLLNITGDSVARCCIVPKWTLPARVNQHVAIIRTTDRLNSAFLQKYLSTPQVKAYVLGHDSGGTRKALTKAHIESFLVPLPPLFEQRRIAHVLGTLGGKIELNRQMNETLEAVARAIYKSWFVDFDPVRAKMEGREPIGMDAETADLFPSAFQDSPLGKIPEGWEVGTLGEIAQNVRRSVKVNEIISEDVYIALEHMPKRNIALSEWQTTDGISSNKSRFRKGEILFGKLRPYFHKVGVAPIDGVCSTDILVIQPIESEWFGVVLGLVSRNEFVAYTDAHSTGTRMPRTNWRDMSRYKFALPRMNVARKYTELIRPLLERIIDNIHQSHTLSQIRDSLLPKLLSGEIRVGSANKRLEVEDGGTS